MRNSYFKKSDVSLFQRKSDGQKGDERDTDEVCHNLTIDIPVF